MARRCPTPGANPAPRAWTVADAPAALAGAGREPRSVVDGLEQVYAGRPSPADLEDRLEDRRPDDVATDVLTTIEAVTRGLLPPAIELPERAAPTTNAELVRELARERRQRIAGAPPDPAAALPHRETAVSRCRRRPTTTPPGGGAIPPRPGAPAP